MRLVEGINEVSAISWSTFVYKHARSNFFQTPELYCIYNLTKNYHPNVIFALDEKNNIVGLLLYVIQKENNGLISGILTSRSLIIGGPLISEGPEYFIILKSLIEYYENIISGKILYTEIRNLTDNKKLKKHLPEFGYNYVPHLNFIVDISEGSESAWMNLSQAKRRGIRKGKANGVKFEECRDIATLKEFAHGLHFFYKEIIHKPLPDVSFFLSLLSDKRISKRVKVFVVRNNIGKVIGGMVCPFYRNTIYEWYIYSDRDQKKFYPSEIATWNPMSLASKRKYKKFDMMGAGKPDQDYGVREFKKGFGGTLVSYGRFKKIEKAFLSKIVFGLYQIYNKMRFVR